MEQAEHDPHDGVWFMERASIVAAAAVGLAGIYGFCVAVFSLAAP